MEQITNENPEIRRKRLEILSKLKSGRAIDSKEYLDIPQELWADRDFSLAVLGIDGMALFCSPDFIRGDQEMVTTACRAFPGAIQAAADFLRSNEEFIVTLGRSIDFKKFPDYGVGNKGIRCFIQDTRIYGTPAIRIEQKIKGTYGTPGHLNQ
jgi:hypothetical protein